MTYEEAIKILDTILTIGEQVDALEMAIEALEKQIPKKPKIELSSAGLIASYYCPICGRYFGDRARNCAILFHTPKYCGCGQAIDWSSE